MGQVQISSASLWVSDVFFLARGSEEKYEQWAKCRLALFVESSKKGCTLASRFLNFIRSYLSIVLIAQGTRERIKQHLRNHLCVPDDKKKPMWASKLVSEKIMYKKLKTKLKIEGNVSVRIVALFHSVIL